MRACAAADRRRRRRRLRRRRRHRRDGVRHPHRHAAREGRVPVQQVGLAGCDMGACAILPRIIGQGRASELLYTGRFMSGRGGRALGLLQPARRAPRRVLGEAQALAREIAAGPTFANAMTKRMLAMEWAMSVEEAIEAEAVAQALCMTTEDFARAYRRLRGEGEAGVRGGLSDARPQPSSTGRSSRSAIARFAARAARPGPAERARAADRPRRRRRLLPAARRRASARAGWLRAVVPAAYGGSSAGFDVRTLCLARETLACRRRPRRFRLRHAGARHRRRSRCSAREELKRRYLPPVGAGRDDRGLRALRARGRLRRRGDRDDRATPDGPDACAPRRREDLDLERRHRRPLRRLRAHRRGAGRAGALGLRGRRRRAGPRGRGAHRGDRAASARDAALRGLPRAARAAHRRAGRGLQGRDGDARRVPLDRRRGGARLRPARARRGARRARRRASCSARRWATCS